MVSHDMFSIIATGKHHMFCVCCTPAATDHYYTNCYLLQLVLFPSNHYTQTN